MKMQFDSVTISLLLGAVITVIGVVFGIKGIQIKNDAKVFAADCAAAFQLWADQDTTPTPAQLDAMNVAVEKVIADALVLGADFGGLFTPVQVAIQRKMALRRG
jgi:microsomal dipeptidase-like Zn-dependent dipeptidase